MQFELNEKQVSIINAVKEFCKDFQRGERLLNTIQVDKQTSIVPSKVLVSTVF